MLFYPCEHEFYKILKKKNKQTDKLKKKYYFSRKSSTFFLYLLGFIISFLVCILIKKNDMLLNRPHEFNLTITLLFDRGIFVSVLLETLSSVALISNL